MFKFYNYETEWEIFQNVIQSPKQIVYGKSLKERKLFEKISTVEWTDNTNLRPDFISEDIMIEMFEVDDIVTTKKGKSNPQRKADARALRDAEEWLNQFSDESFKDGKPLIIAHGDTRYNPETDEFTPDNSVSHHNYQAYLNNFERICFKHLKNVDAYKKNYPNKQLGFLIIDDSTYYASPKNLNGMSGKDAFLNFPYFDKNFMKLFVKSEVEFIVWAFNNKYFYTTENKHRENSFLPKIVLICKDNYYTKHSKYFDVSSMFSLEE